jgi:hypothetical protein
MKNLQLLSVASFLLTSCANTDSGDIFKNPARFAGKKVKVCGYVRNEFENQGIWLSRSDYQKDENGLGYIAGAKSATSGQFNGSTRCVSGSIVRTGCGKELMCNQSSAEFALLLENVTWPEIKSEN